MTAKPTTEATSDATPETDAPAPEAVELVIPTDFSTVDDAALSELHTTATAAFDAAYRGGQDLSAEDLEVLTQLTAGIESVLAEQASRKASADERASAAAELATRIGFTAEDPEATSDEDEAPADDDIEALAEETPEPALVASSTLTAPRTGSQAPAPLREVRVNLAALKSRAGTTKLPAQALSQAPRGIEDMIFAASEGSTVPMGAGLDWHGVGQTIDRRLASFNEAQYVTAQRSGTPLNQQFAVASIRKGTDPALVVNSSDRGHVEDVLNRATDQTRLTGNSLVASGGWCAPSPTDYEFPGELESRGGLVSLPSINVTRGGLHFTKGLDFSAIYASTGFAYTEAQDIAGTYAVDANGNGTGAAGDKPCYKVPCPAFEEVRLNLAGLCLSAGLLQQRGYPEAIARTVRGALVAHDHKMSARLLSAMATGSTAITMPAAQTGAAAPLLTAIELQVTHFRYTHRMSSNATLEAVFPEWVRSAIRSDLSRRPGLAPVSAFEVSDAQVNGWFAQRGISAQFVVDWQPVAGAATAFTAWPATVEFLLYAAGTWVRGSSDVISLDTLYSSDQLGQNDFTALFMEEGWMIMKRRADSRRVIVPVCADGSVAAGVDFACDGTVAP